MTDHPDDSDVSDRPQERSPYHATWSLLRALVAPPAAGATVLLEPGTLVGDRYRVKGTLGRGGMGAVYLAGDEQLDRDVALKIQLRPDAEDARERLAREARALARLSHPNVVAVHEVGEYQGHLFIAMEYVEGDTLTAWLRRSRRKITEIVALFVEAGRGLAAAHEVGLVHRDFKPDNVLVGKDGRARVADFGLALRPEDEPEPSAEAGQADPGDGLSRIVGTPAYMAPEQIQGAGVDARTDQFAFCVALFEAIYGRRPFEADTLEELFRRISSGQRDRRAAGKKVPLWLDRALTRGLAARPANRFHSTRALLNALKAGPRRVRRRWTLVVSLLALLLAGVAGAVLWSENPSRICQGAGSRLASVWNQSARQTLRTSFKKTDLPFAGRTASAVEARLDRYGQAWVEEHTRSCQATRLYAQQSEQALDLRTSCLERRLGEFRAVLGLLGEADGLMVERALELTGSLARPETCSDVQRLGRILPLPTDPAEAEVVRKARERVFQAWLLARSGREKQARALLEDVAKKDALGYLPLRAEWNNVMAEAHRAGNEYEEAEKGLREAARLAAAAGHDLVLVRAMANLALILATRYAPVEETDSWLELARAASTRLGQDEELEVKLRGNESSIRSCQGRYVEAVASAKRAVEIREKQRDPVALSRALTVLGLAHVNNGEARLARQVQERAVAQLRGVVGVEHPAYLHALLNLGSACKLVGDYPAAFEHTRLAAEVTERVQGPDSTLLGALRANLGSILLAQGRTEEARAYHERVLDRHRRRHESDHPEVGYALGNLAVLLGTEGHYDQAQPYAVQSREMLARALGADHPDLVNADSIIGTIERHRGKLEDSARALEQALERADRVLQPDHPGRINPRVELARTELARKRIQEAMRLAREALKQAEAEHIPDQMRPDVWFALAEVLWEAGEQRDQALAYARKAEAGWKKLGMHQELAKARAWLRRKPTIRQ